MEQPQDQVIAAVATPAGEGGIGIVRISGSGAAAIGDALYSGRTPESLSAGNPYRLRLGDVRDPRTGEHIDEVLAVWMPAGRSYTGEHTVEIHAHGGPAVLDAIVECCLALGARLARPGEFTRRAFLNRRMDLTQAEAVAALIGARSGTERRAAFAQLRGGLGGRIRELRDRVLDLAASAEALIDFTEEEAAAETFPVAALLEAARSIREVEGEGRTPDLRPEGIRIVVVGRTNAGKSSIFNELSNKQRSIVTPVPGTTRDYIEQTASFGGAAVTLVDTAGIRESRDEIEAEGVRRSRELIDNAGVVVLVIDGSVPMTSEDRDLALDLVSRRPLIIVSKSDLPRRLEEHPLREIVADLPLLETSTVSGDGFPELREALTIRCRELLPDGPVPTATPNLRQRDALGRAAALLESAGEGFTSGTVTLDMVSTDIGAALRALGEITGETATDEILERVFNRFCVGK